MLTGLSGLLELICYSDGYQSSPGSASLIFQFVFLMGYYVLVGSSDLMIKYVTSGIAAGCLCESGRVK